MFEQLKALAPDPLLGLIEQYRQDSSPDKVDLGVGVYKNERGDTPVLDSVKAAEAQLLKTEESKSYVGPAGNLSFNQSMLELVFGDAALLLKERLVALQTPGGCGALRVLAELISTAKPAAKVWVSDPTWVNHVPLLGNAGVQLETYPYYDFESSSLRFDEMISALTTASAGDVILVHGCCHNPCGADLSQSQWHTFIDLCEAQSLIPFIDMAYQGFGHDLQQDAYGVRLAAQQLPELLVAVSCSKNFGLYRERVGAAFVLSQGVSSAAAVDSHMKSVTRGMYSMPPSHGASIVANILGSSVLSAQWADELAHMRTRIQQVRLDLSQGLRLALSDDRFDFIPNERGMFSFLGITPEQVQRLAGDYSIYMAGSSRINLAGLNGSNVQYCVDALEKVIKS